MNYFFLLRSLFRSIGGGRFEALYEEILPLLEMMLEVLNNLLLAARKPHYLMRALVVALRAGSDLVGRGLRTLELRVDNLTAECLDPIMAPMIDELMTALWDHLRPNPYSHYHAHTIIRILGKLGGRNRDFLSGPPQLTFKPYADDEPSIDIKFIGSSKERAFPASLGVDVAISKLGEYPKSPQQKKADIFYKQQAFRLVSVGSRMYIGFSNLPDDFAHLVRLQANDCLEGNAGTGPDVVLLADREKSIAKKDIQEDTLKKLLMASIPASTLPDLASCYEEEWFIKAGGGLGIHILPTKLDLGDHWMVTRLVDFIRALFYVIKDMPLDLPANTRVQGLETVKILLRRCNRDIPKEDLHSHSSRLFDLCGFLIFELAHMNKHVREAAQTPFAVIADVIGVQVHQLLSPVKERLLQSIYNKPLRALPFPTHIGYIEAIAYCIPLEKDFIEFNKPLSRLLMESLALADAADEVLTTKPRLNEFNGSQHIQSKSRIIAVFFQSLYSHSAEVIEAANTGLGAVLKITNKLPNELLQNGLRPILMNLQDPKKLSVQGLNGLARLLALLTNYFKVEIGERLLDHIRAIADKSVHQKSSFALIEQNPQMKVVLATLNIFHLLPATPNAAPSAETFMQDLVDRVLELEEALRRTHNSPFRVPLLKYRNRYDKAACTFFSLRLSDMKYGRLFALLNTRPSSMVDRTYLRRFFSACR
ncbi:MAG: hypothetical protein Q9180_001071 [Flavoplaca navasiana]